MARRILLIAAGIALALPLLYGQITKPPAADQILNVAMKEAAGSGRNIMVVFHASWCSWCKKLDAFLGSADVKPIIDANYVVTHLDVMERAGKKDSLENPGGAEVLKSYGGEKSGIPFFVFLDASGKKLADSNVMPGDNNIGFPGSPEEIDAFGTLLRKTAPHMTDQQRATVLGLLKKPS